MKGYVDLMSLPLGTRIYVESGCYYAKICGTKDLREIYIEETGLTHVITERDADGVIFSVTGG